MTGEARLAPAPGFPVTVGMLIHDAAGRLLIVRAARSGRWQLPGGLVETGESPRQAARREVREELGLDIQPTDLVAADWIAPRTPGRRARLALVFSTPSLPTDLLCRVRLQTEEVSAWRMAPLHQAQRLLHSRVAERLPTTPTEPRATLYRELPPPERHHP
ncbi:NUDIX hydrolase [Streptomyces sp. NBRC 109706]|uniref:NUDIX domain-containing protein n=1 Tax=Streptomyces sp. NBRC 109706 TaxID=1550035 RepID=UPI00131E6411|nr:NUDIX hydrolase [Streptomyces sp. NBRC 109706]